MNISSEVKKDLKILIDENLKHWQGYIEEPLQDDDDHSVQLTVGLNDAGTEWGYQTGDNSFTGGAYSSPHWAVVYFDSETNADSLLEDLLRDIEDIEVFSTRSEIVEKYNLHSTYDLDEYYGFFGDLPEEITNAIDIEENYSIVNDRSTIFRDSIVFSVDVELDGVSVTLHQTIFSVEEWNDREIEETEFKQRLEVSELNDIRVTFND